jgi:adenylosuccinate synthase
MNVVVIGAQWGDEGKGKVVDYLAEQARIVVRYSGGANAGHTIVQGDKTYKLHLIPSGVLYPETTVVLGTGMVIDLQALFEELDTLTEQGVDWEGRVLVSDRAHVVLPAYRDLDREEDEKRERPLGTTGRGIGIAYSKKAARDGIRLADLAETSVQSTMDASSRSHVAEYLERLEPMTVDLVDFMDHASRTDHVLFEGAQGALLDLDQGTYPFVSSGYSAAAGASMGGGIGPRQIDKVIGVAKAYTTRVGNGPFPSELRSSDEESLEAMMRELGREYGVTTGRPRRCGYLDLVALRYIVKANGIDALALTHLDVYDTVESIKVCVAYETDDGVQDSFPSSAYVLERCRPVTKTLPGWQTAITDIPTYDNLPGNAKAYIEFIEQFVECPIQTISVGYKRSQTIQRIDPWTRS